MYDDVRATHEEVRPDISVILTEYVEGYGDLGDPITVSSTDARNYLLPAQLAIYDTNENRQRVSLEIRDAICEKVARMKTWSAPVFVSLYDI